MIVTQKQLAECFGLSLRRVQQLQKDGIIHRDRSVNGYRLEECNQAYLEYKINAETGRSDNISKEKMQTQHEKVKMDISKLKLKKMKREVLDAASVERYWTDAVLRIRNKVMSLPSKIVMSTSGEDVTHAIETATKICEDALDELADYDPELIEADMDYEDSEEDAEEDEEE